MVAERREAGQNLIDGVVGGTCCAYSGVPEKREQKEEEDERIEAGVDGRGEEGVVVGETP